MKKIGVLLATLGLLSITTGCAVNRATANVENPAALNKVKTLHVTKVDADQRGINVLIADKFKARGYNVTTGNDKPKEVDAIVTYLDKWMWDITMYMIELTITVRDPKTEFPIATGNSLHTSLTRKSPTEMVDEVVENILKQGK